MRNIILLVFCLITGRTYADFAGYADSVRLTVESKNYIVIHFHNWTNSTNDARYKMITTDQNPFTSSNDYSYLECIDKRTGKVIFKKPCSAFTKIEISKDEKYIVGISKIKLDNPFQLVIFTTAGELIKKRHIGCEEAKLTKEQFAEFKNNYPTVCSFIDSNNQVFRDSNFIFVDFMYLPQDRLGKTWEILFKYVTRNQNHLSSNFSESVTNWIHWYYEINPEIIFNYTKNELSSISLLDPNKSRIEIKVKE